MNIDISTPYWRLHPWAFTEYNVSTVAAAKYYPGTGVIDIMQQGTLLAPIRRTVVPVPGLQYPGVAVVDTAQGQAPPADWPTSCKSLYLGLYKPPTGPAFIGETGAAAVNGWPPECELTVNPVAGEIINGSTGGCQFDADGTAHQESLDFQYRTIGPGGGPGGTWFWPQYPDQILCSLRERPTQLSYVYTYVFARNVGMIWSCWGQLNSDYTLSDAMQWQISNYG